VPPINLSNLYLEYHQANYIVSMWRFYRIKRGCYLQVEMEAADAAIVAMAAI
jgi:replicative superfamily II helicase